MSAQSPPILRNMARKRVKSIDEKIVDNIQQLEGCNRIQAWARYTMRMQLLTLKNVV
jgi:hypothetical protein